MKTRVVRYSTRGWLLKGSIGRYSTRRWLIKGRIVRYNTRRWLVWRDLSDIAPDDDWWRGALPDIAPDDNWCRYHTCSCFLIYKLKPSMKEKKLHVMFVTFWNITKIYEMSSIYMYNMSTLNPIKEISFLMKEFICRLLAIMNFCQRCSQL